MGFDSDQLKILTFDMGDTLVEYEGIPLNWEARYPDALARLSAFVGAQFTPAAVESARAVLRRYNTRLNPRQVEISFGQVLSDLMECYSVTSAPDESGCAEAFFSVFRQRLRCFPDVIPFLSQIRGGGRKIGVFTDVPYGMPRNLVMDDLARAGLNDLVDVLITSEQAGYRKPSPHGLQALSVELGCLPGDMAYAGNERKDVEAALAFGCEAVLLDRNGLRPAWGQHRTITSLNEL